MITSAFGSGSLKKSPAGGLDTIRQTFPRDCFLRNGLDCRQIEGSASEMRMFFRDERREKTGGSTHVTEGFVFREIELLRQCREVAA